MQLVMFSKTLKDLSAAQLRDWALEVGLDGYDLCVRPDYAVNPDNVETALPDAVACLGEAGLVVPMVTANFDVLWPDATVEPLLAGMRKAGVSNLKLGYYKFDPAAQEYWDEVEKIRRGFAGWSELSRRFGVKICYHTHSHRCMGLNGAALSHLVQGMDPECIGAYLDAGHLAAEGEEFPVAVAMVRRHLSLVAVKDMGIWRVERHGHGAKKHGPVPAGSGFVDWTQVFETLQRVGYDGPVSVHCEFQPAAGEVWKDAVAREVAFFRRFVPKAG